MQQPLPIPAPSDREGECYVLRGLISLAPLATTLKGVPEKLKEQLRQLQAQGISGPTTVCKGYKSDYPEYAALWTAGASNSSSLGYQTTQIALVAALAVWPEMSTNTANLDIRVQAGRACRLSESNGSLRRCIDLAAQQATSLSTFGEQLRVQSGAFTPLVKGDKCVLGHLRAIALLIERAVENTFPPTRPRDTTGGRQIWSRDPDDDTQIDAVLMVDRGDPKLEEERKKAGAAPTGEFSGTRQAGVRVDPPRESRGKSPAQSHRQATYLSRAVTTQNQHLPAASDRLQLHDLQILFAWLRIAHDGKGLAAAKAEQAKELTAMSLIFGASLETLLTVRVVGTAVEIDRTKAGIPWLVLDGCYLTVRRPILLDAFIPDPSEAALYEVVDDWQIWPYMDTFPGMDRAIARARAGLSGQLYAGNAKQWLGVIQPALNKLNSADQSRLTPTRIASFLQRFVADLTGDVAKAALCALGGLDDNCAARLYYFAPIHDDISRHYTRAIDLLHRSLTEGTAVSQYQPTSPSRMGRVGSRSYPQEGEIIRAVAALASSVPQLGKGRPSERRLVEVHNQLVAYTVTMVQWATGARAVKDPIEIALTDLVDGQVVISDKDGDSYAEARIAALPEVARKQLEAYSVHRDQLSAHRKFQGLVRSAPSWLFFIVDGKPLLVTPSLLEVFRGKAYPFRGNVQRHYLRTKLAELGTAGSLIDAQLGHGALGEAAFGRFSCFLPSDLKTVVSPRIGGLLDRLGWKVVPGLPPPRRPQKGRRRIFLPEAPDRKTGGIAQRAAGREKAAAVRARRKQEIRNEARSSIWRYFMALNGGGGTKPVMRFEGLQKLLPGYDRQWERRHLNVVTTDILKIGEAEGLWTVETLPPQVVRLRRDPSPFRPSRVASLRIVREIHRRHIRHTQLLAAQPDAKGQKERDRRLRVRAGQLLVSAVLDSGLVANTFVQQWPAAVADGMYESGGRVWVDFAHSPGNRDDVFEAPMWTRRWFPTPLTASLLLRWKLDGLAWPSGKGMSINAILRTYFAALGVHYTGSGEGKQAHVRFDNDPHIAVDAASPLTLLLRGGRTALYTRIPRLLADFACDPTSNCSMDITSWARVISGRALGSKPASVDAVSRERLENEPDNSSSPSDKAVRNGDQQATYKRILHCLRGPQGYVERPRARRELEALLTLIDGEQSPLLRQLAEWPLWCLTARDIGGGTLRVSSTYQYLRAIASPLLLFGAHLSTDQVRGLDECEALIAAYDEAVESIRTSKARQYASQRIAEFHAFLTKRLATPPIKWRGYDTYTKQKPSANLITEAEFAVMRRSVDAAACGDRQKKLLHLLLIFGYRLGLRRDEIAARQLNCLQGLPRREDSNLPWRPQLWIHAVHRGSIKRRASNRRLPLAHLLTSEELDLLVDWAKLRASEVGDSRTGTERLFAAAPGATAKLADADGFSGVSQLIRDVTGDDTLDFHHLRHSFVSLHTARMLWPEGSAQLSEMDLASLQPPEGLAGKDLLRKVMLSDKPLRSTMYQIAALAGHIDPQETVGTYCHTLDLLLERYLDQETPPLTTRQAQYLLGMSDGAQRVSRHRAKAASGASGQASRLSRPDDKSPLLAAYFTLVEKARRKKLFLPLPELRPIIEQPLQYLGNANESFPPLAAMNRLLGLAGPKEALKHRAEVVSIPIGLARLIRDAADRFASRSKTAFRDPQRCRSRATLKRDSDANASIDPRQLPETAGLARAIPKPPHERAEAESVYASLVEAMLEGTLSLEEVINVFNTTSRSSGRLNIKTREQFGCLAKVLKTAGIGRARLSVEVLAVGRNETTKAATTHTARALNLEGKQVAVVAHPRELKRSEAFAPLYVRVLPTLTRQANQQAQKPGAMLKASYGWSVGLFYALVCGAALRLHLQGAGAP